MRNLFQESFSLEGLPDELASGLMAIARTVPVKAGQVLFDAGEPGNGCYVVLEGALKVVLQSGEGAEQLLAVFTPGGIVGELSLFDGRPRSACVIALKPSRLAFIEKSAFHRFGDDNPALYRHMLCIVGRRLRHVNDTLAARSFLPLPGRVAQALLQLADTYGHDVDRGRILVHYKFSQTDLANMAGGARENVSRILNEWKREGTISLISGYYCIEDAATLRSAAQV